MCQATIYLGEQEIAREVTRLEMVEGGVRLAIFWYGWMIATMQGTSMPTT
jgi:hypothetical protein